MAHQLSGTQVSEILNPTNGYRGALIKKGIQPKDHMRENMRIIKEKQRENREKAEHQETKNVFKLSKFANVSSTLKKKLEVGVTNWYIYVHMGFGTKSNCIMF